MLSTLLPLDIDIYIYFIELVPDFANHLQVLHETYIKTVVLVIYGSSRANRLYIADHKYILLPFQFQRIGMCNHSQ